MEHRATEDFWLSYSALPLRIKSLADKQFLLLKRNPAHPSLQFKKIGERRGLEIWSARVTLAYRALAIKLPDKFLWIWIGDHESYDRRI
jgi:hypothetical protein